MRTVLQSKLTTLHFLCNQLKNGRNKLSVLHYTMVDRLDRNKNSSYIKTARKLQIKCSVMTTVLETKLTTLHFLHNQLTNGHNKLVSYITLGWKGLKGTKPIAY